MRIIKDTYGADADGNRSVTTYDYELDKHDNEAIRDELERIIVEDEYDYLDEVVVQLQAPYHSEVPFENMISFKVFISEYLTKNEFDSIIKDNV